MVQIVNLLQSAKLFLVVSLSLKNERKEAVFSHNGKRSGKGNSHAASLLP